MAALKDSNPMPNDVDDLTDTSPQIGSSDSGSNVYGAFSMTSFSIFATTPGSLLETLGTGGGGGGTGSTDSDDVWAVISG
jgi:hypothetical protein